MTELDTQIKTILNLVRIDQSLANQGSPGNYTTHQALAAIKAAVATYVVGETEYPSYQDGVVVDENGDHADDGESSSNLANHAVYKTGANALRATQRRLLEGGE